MSDFDVVLRQRDRFATGNLDFEVIGQQMNAATGRAETGALGQLGLKRRRLMRDVVRLLIPALSSQPSVSSLYLGFDPSRSNRTTHPL